MWNPAGCGAGYLELRGNKSSHAFAYSDQISNTWEPANKAVSVETIAVTVAMY